MPRYFSRQLLDTSQLPPRHFHARQAGSHGRGPGPQDREIVPRFHVPLLFREGAVHRVRPRCQGHQPGEGNGDAPDHERASCALGQMASGLAHEINTPLASIAGCAEGLLMKVRNGRYDARALRGIPPDRGRGDPALQEHHHGNAFVRQDLSLREKRSIASTRRWTRPSRSSASRAGSRKSMIERSYRG